MRYVGPFTLHLCLRPGLGDLTAKLTSVSIALSMPEFDPWDSDARRTAPSILPIPALLLPCLRPVVHGLWGKTLTSEGWVQ